MKYLNDQIKELYEVSEADYVRWCKDNKKSMSYKETVSDFLYRMRTGRLVKDSNGNLIRKKPRKEKPVR